MVIERSGQLSGMPFNRGPFKRRALYPDMDYPDMNYPDMDYPDMDYPDMDYPDMDYLDYPDMDYLDTDSPNISAQKAPMSALSGVHCIENEEWNIDSCNGMNCIKRSRILIQ